MLPQVLLDTHVVIRWLTEPKKLSKDQLRVLDSALKRDEPLGVSTITLVEIGLLLGSGNHRLKTTPGELLGMLAASAEITVLPITFEIAAEIASVGADLRDPADRTIVATARVHRLRLVTSDQRIIHSKLVYTIE